MMRKLSREELIEILVSHEFWLQGAGGEVACFSNTDLQGVDFQGAKLELASFSRACLRHTNLKGTNLEDADLRHADLTGAKLDAGILRAGDIYFAHFSPDALPWLMLRADWHIVQWSVNINKD
jgi:hypothetical protein